MKTVCPHSCSGGTQDRQRDMTDGMLSKLPDDHRKAVGTPKRCSYCGCVYDSVSKRVFGKYDPPMGREGWHPR